MENMNASSYSENRINNLTTISEERFNAHVRPSRFNPINIDMPKRKFAISEEPVTTRPQRNMRAKKVFDPSDNNVPKRRVKSTKPANKKRNQDVKSKSQTTNELLSYSSTDTVSVSPTSIQLPHSLSIIPSEFIEEKPIVCFICSKTIHKKELVDCSICKIKAHRECLIINEPMWKFKLDLCPWFCKTCRIRHCCECLQNDFRESLERRCITCNVGLHLKCYESLGIKPLHTIQANMYVCIPCMTLATHRVPEEDEDDEGPLDSRPSSISLLTSDEDDDDVYDTRSDSSEISENFHNQYADNREDIPNVTNWDKFDVHNYLVRRLPQSVVDSLLLDEFDGRALLLFRRTNIASLKMKLGSALKFYKEVRILQSQKTYYSVYWE